MRFEGLFLQRVVVFFINVFLEQIKNLLQALSPPHPGGTWMSQSSQPLLLDSTPGHGGN